MPTTAQAHHWLERWDRQQEHYIADREDRFDVIADVVSAACGRRPLVLDLGAGPGSLAVRLLRRLPEARVIAVDADPLLLGLARAAHDGTPGLRLVERDLRDADWTVALGADSPVDAVVSTTALHWLTSAELATLYATCASVLRPGGVLVNGDHLDDPAGSRLAGLGRHVAAERRSRVGAGARQDWRSWWDDVAVAPELAHLIGERGPRPVDHHVHDVPGLAEHVRLLRAAGFREAGTVWQENGDDRVLVAVR